MRDAPAAIAITLRSLGALAPPPGSLSIALVGCPYGALASIARADAGTVSLTTVAASADKELRTTSTAEKVADGRLAHRCSATTEPRDTRAIPMLVLEYARTRTGCEARHFGENWLVYTDAALGFSVVCSRLLPAPPISPTAHLGMGGKRWAEHHMWKLSGCGRRRLRLRGALARTPTRT